MKEDAIIGCLLGTAVGDALGLPYEGMSPERGRKIFADSTKYHLVFGKGMFSDDTEHACFTAQAVIRSNGNVGEFRHQLAHSLRWWLLALPAGVGFATARAILKLWLGFPPTKSGVFSAGNGPAMRSSILGVAFGHDGEKLKNYVKACTEITHTDPKAYYAALAVAIASRGEECSDDSKWQGDYLRSLKHFMAEAEAEEFLDLAQRAAASAAKGESVTVFAESIGSEKGITGYSYHTVPCVLQAWFRYGDNYEQGIQEIIRAGGDTDTTAAIFGGIVGARAGKQCIPEKLLDNIVDWPRTIGWIESLGRATGQALAKKLSNAYEPRYFWPGVLPRNFAFLLIVLAHGLRRLLPPY